MSERDNRQPLQPTYKMGDDALLAREYLTKLFKAESKPDEIKLPEGLGSWQSICFSIQQPYIIGWRKGGSELAAKHATAAYDTLTKQNPALRTLVSPYIITPSKNPDGWQGKQAPPLEQMSYVNEDGEKITFNAYLDPSGGESARGFLDDCSAFIKKWSPRGHALYHEAAALFLLSAVAKRRIVIPVGIGMHTSLYIMFCSEPAQYTKSTVLNIATEVLRRCDLEHVLWEETMTLQYMFERASGRLPKDFDTLKPRYQEKYLRELKWCGQRALIKDEFGSQLAQMSNKNTPIKTFLEQILKWESFKQTDTDATVGSGARVVEQPYMPLLVSVTPENIKNMHKDNALWGNGFFSRFAVLCPPKLGYSLAPWPDRRMDYVPDSIRKRLVQFDSLLGDRTATPVPIVDKKGEETGLYTTDISELPQKECRFGMGTWQAYQNYVNALTIMANEEQYDIKTELKAWYQRAPDKALRIAALLAWENNQGVIELSHWTAAQNIVEGWRNAIHEFFFQINDIEATFEKRREDHLLTVIERKGGWCSLTDLRKSTGLSTEQILKFLQMLHDTGRLMKLEISQPTRGPKMESPFIWGDPTFPIPEKYASRIKPEKEDEKKE